jgi:hypothetical protein
MKNATIDISTKVLKAAVLGTQACKSGRKAIPCLDADLMNLLSDIEVSGGSMPIMEAWLSAWHDANLANAI